jgi:hypothetical protein
MGTVPKDKTKGLNIHKITSKMELLSKYNLLLKHFHEPDWVHVCLCYYIETLPNS